jgi:hypothetical protein
MSREIALIEEVALAFINEAGQTQLMRFLRKFRENLASNATDPVAENGETNLSLTLGNEWPETGSNGGPQ